MLILLYILFFSCLTTQSVFSQQQPLASISFDNPFAYNPAAGGLSNVSTVQFAHRTQWIGIDQAPRTMMLHGTTVIERDHEATREDYTGENWFFDRPNMTSGVFKQVLGVSLFKDEIGIFNTTQLTGNYALHLPINRSWSFGAGLRLGYESWGIAPNRVILYDQQDELYATTLSQNTTDVHLHVGLGLILYGNRNIIGFSTTQLLNNTAQIVPSPKSHYQRHYILHLSHIFPLKRNSIEPTLIVKTTQYAPLSIDYGLRYLYNNSTWCGIYARNINAAIIQVGSTIIRNIYISYTHELGLSKLRGFTNSSHELSLGVYFGKKKKEKTEDIKATNE